MAYGKKNGKDLIDKVENLFKLPEGPVIAENIIDWKLPSIEKRFYPVASISSTLRLKHADDTTMAKNIINWQTFSSGAVKATLQIKLPNNVVIAENSIEWQMLTQDIIKVVFNQGAPLFFTPSGKRMKGIKGYGEIGENFYYLETSDGKDIYQRDGTLVVTNIKHIKVERVERDYLGFTTIKIKKKRKWYQPFKRTPWVTLRQDGQMMNARYEDVNNNFYSIKTFWGKNVYHKSDRLVATNVSHIIRCPSGAIVVKVTKKTKNLAPFDDTFYITIGPDGKEISRSHLPGGPGEKIDID